jgi:threonylcarbamoyladenosine tRNA methylthiotransferase MtaB
VNNPGVSIFTLGCKLNQLESEALAAAFRGAGFSLLPWGDGAGGAEPDILVINTCTVTSRADQKARRLVRKALLDFPRCCVIVTGCYAQLDAAEIEGLEAEAAPFPGGRLFVIRGRAKDVLLDLPEYLRKTAPSAAPSAVFGGADFSSLIRAWDKGRSAASAAFRFSPEDFSFHSRAFLKIQDGCDYRCTYCRVCLARGPSVSLDAAKALEALQSLEARGYAEAVLTGVNISRYRDGVSRGLGELLEYLLAGTRRIALRLSSLEPETVNESFVRFLAHSRIRPHFHLSVQSGSPGILSGMGRRYGPGAVEDAAALFRRVKDDPFLACDIITGFPGETEEEFEKTRELCRRIDFAWIHAFPYSKRPGTPAFSFKNQISRREASARMEILLELARRGREAYVRRWQGRETTVLVEGKGAAPGPAGEGFCRGTSENYLKLRVRYAGSQPPKPGAILRCVIEEAASPNAEGLDAQAREIACTP